MPPQRERGMAVLGRPAGAIRKLQYPLRSEDPRLEVAEPSAIGCGASAGNHQREVAAGDDLQRPIRTGCWWARDRQRGQSDRVRGADGKKGGALRTVVKSGPDGDARVDGQAPAAADFAAERRRAAGVRVAILVPW